MADDTTDKSGGAGSFIAGLLIGGAIGVLGALLYAPQGGDETRGLVKKKKDEYSDLAKNKVSDRKSVV